MHSAAPTRNVLRDQLFFLLKIISSCWFGLNGHDCSFRLKLVVPGHFADSLWMRKLRTPFIGPDSPSFCSDVFPTFEYAWLKNIKSYLVNGNSSDMSEAIISISLNSFMIHLSQTSLCQRAFKKHRIVENMVHDGGKPYEYGTCTCEYCFHNQPLEKLWEWNIKSFLAFHYNFSRREDKV